MSWQILLLVATALHVGFQVTLSVVVYPALVQIPPASWRTAHGNYWLRVVPLIALVYVLAALACAGVLFTGATASAWVASVATTTTIGLTVLAAIPLHRRLELAPDVALLRRLTILDRVRTAVALVALVGAVVAST